LKWKRSFLKKLFAFVEKRFFSIMD
jgi:hypothetical protein